MLPSAHRLFVVLFDRSFMFRNANGTSAISPYSFVYSSSYLARRDKLQGPKGTLHVRDVGLELIQGGGDAGLDLGGLLPRWAVGRDLVECLLRHDGGVVEMCRWKDAWWRSSSELLLQIEIHGAKCV